MDIERIKKEIQDEDFVIRIRPFADDDGKWTGEIDVSIIAFPDNPMDDDDYGQVMHFAKMMCATVPIMEESKEIRDIAHDYVMEVIDNEMDISVELEEEAAGVEKTYDGNIVHLNFNSKTEAYGNVDMVNNPPHYNQTGIECIHAISAATDTGFKYYLQGNILKYLWRFDYKDKPLEDLQKAKWYLDKLIEEVMADGKS